MLLEEKLFQWTQENNNVKNGYLCLSTCFVPDTVFRTGFRESHLIQHYKGLYYSHFADRETELQKGY